MKKYLGILILLFSLSANAQKLSEQFKVQEYAEKQTEIIKTALDINGSMVEELYKANMFKARSIQKYIMLSESEGKTVGKKLKQVIKEVEVRAEKSSGYENSLHAILGADLFKEYMKKFGHQ